MPDKRSNRKASVIQFLSRLDKNRSVNLVSLIERGKQLELEGFDRNEWEKNVWTITAGRLTKQSGKRSGNVELGFCYAPALGGAAIEGQWADLLKALVVSRFHRDHQAVTNQRNFIAAASFVALEMIKSKLQVYQLTPKILDDACQELAKHYSEGVTYNMHKAIGELAAHCDSNRLCNVLLNYKYAGMKRPANAGGFGHKRLDDPETLVTEGDKLLKPKVYRVIGELYSNVPAKHKYRVYVLLLSLLVALGRRLAEVSLLPRQSLKRDDDGRAYLDYFPRKQSKGDVHTPLKKLYLATDTIEIVEPIIVELNELCQDAHNTAMVMDFEKDPDLSFLMGISNDQRFYKEDLIKFGISPTLLDTNGWIRVNGFAFPDATKLTAQGKAPPAPIQYTTSVGIEAYCRSNFDPRFLEPIHIDAQGKKYYLKDLLIVRPLGLSSGAYAHWISTQITHSMFTTFLRYFKALAEEYASSSIEVDFTSHDFRRTMNTLLDEGGLSDLLQTEWFDRSNPKDTKAYQHTSREKRALLLRADIIAGRVGGRLVEQLKRMPIDLRDAVLAARVNAVHDVGPGICIHNFSQTPCSRHLQCSAECDDYVWAKGDKGRVEEVKRQYAITVVARKTAEAKIGGKKPKKSADWLAHNEKKLKVLSDQMRDLGIEPFDPYEYLERRANEKTIQTHE